MRVTKTKEIEYKFICSNRKYRDNSLIGCLKLLLKEHKIHRVEYKESIKRILSKKPLKHSIYSKIHYYLVSLKGSRAKNTLKALQQKEQQNKRFIVMRAYNNSNYSVFIKKPKFKDLIINKHLSIEYKDLMIKAIQKEFDNKLRGDNKA